MTRPLVLNSYQQNILEWVLHGSGNAVVKATAGSGKTTTLVEIAKVLPPDISTRFLAFNKHIAHELQQRLPKHVKAQTIHSLGLSALKSAYPWLDGIRPEAGKYARLAGLALRQGATSGDLSADDFTKAQVFLRDLVRYAQHTLCDPADLEAVRELAIQYNLTPPDDLDLERLCYQAVPKVLRVGAAAVRGPEPSLGYEDMLYLPVRRKLPPPRFDFVLVDEAQDLSPAQLELTLSALAEGGRAIYVGDERQSIYGFAGADADAIGRIVERSQATMLPLPVCYRCPKTHVRLARQIAPEIEWAPDAPEGRVDWIEDRHLAKWLRQGDLVLCRYNAPLVRWCLEMLRQGQRATVRGRELGEEILRIAKAAVRRGRANPAGLATHIEALLAEEIGRIRAQGHDLEMRARLEEARRDLYAAARAVIEDGLQRGLKTYAELERHTLALFDAEQNPIVFSTVHRAKGDEADRVFILHSEAMMAAYAKTPAAVAGEECVQFVALTRARRHLVFVRQAKADEDELPEFSRVVS
ncbi:UvrD-helicase domain-containing protein [Meiothermus granaticius]|uniref:DNA 3'-5' helicase n=1 Tax=Meiothermus granaticius NBRC 107808 TaxID=1227551 RepID=A0A399FBE9_9DEIN|nr:UvrD-helicase domain-containing protein [Meiothermus granaticius]MCL6527546.1 UvrD-helicase domain-containing protein [Thermaceae bacterium]RIH93538.1 ATP-dependent DNA helicase Rep [Meiothermus granaticius NBRC 107808]GEM86034.1 DNA helicase [Meiothermus granaticius NBRC 107808]